MHLQPYLCSESRYAPKFGRIDCANSSRQCVRRRITPALRYCGAVNQALDLAISVGRKMLSKRPLSLMIIHIVVSRCIVLETMVCRSIRQSTDACLASRLAIGDHKPRTSACKQRLIQTLDLCAYWRSRLYLDSRRYLVCLVQAGRTPTSNARSCPPGFMKGVIAISNEVDHRSARFFRYATARIRYDEHQEPHVIFCATVQPHKDVQQSFNQKSPLYCHSDRGLVWEPCGVWVQGCSLGESEIWKNVITWGRIDCAYAR